MRKTCTYLLHGDWTESDKRTSQDQIGSKAEVQAGDGRGLDQDGSRRDDGDGK